MASPVMPPGCLYKESICLYASEQVWLFHVIKGWGCSSSVGEDQLISRGPGLHLHTQTDTQTLGGVGGVIWVFENRYEVY